MNDKVDESGEKPDPLVDIESDLWWGPEIPADRDLIMEQYKICLAMTDKISNRRGSANSFFLTLNTAVIGAIAAFFNDLPTIVSVAIFLAAAVLCGAWWALLQSYRSLNEAKFNVVGAMERRLPSSPIYRAEWTALGKGSNWRKHIPLGVVERTVPMVFFAVYLVLLIVKAFCDPAAETGAVGSLILVL